LSQQINLFNPIFLKQKRYLSAATIVQALGMLLAGALLLAAWTGYQASSLREEAEVGARQLAAAQSQLNSLSGAASGQKDEALENKVRDTEAELKAMRQVFDVLRAGELGNTRGYSEYMGAFARQSVDGLWLTGFGIHGAGAEIALYGRALRAELVPAFIGRLGREPVLQGKSFAALDIRVPQGSGDKADAAPAPYLEFSLRSAGLTRESAETGGK
jgi:hypothetical protein